MVDQPIESLRNAAATGDIAALTRLGERLLSGSAPAEIAEAAWALDRATQTGGVDAPARLAVLFALGAGRPRNWTAALDLLQIGAERGSEAARIQLTAMAGEDAVPDAGAPNRWRRARDSVDINTWTEAGPHEVLCRSPRIRRYDRFISSGACEWIISRAMGRVTTARVFDPIAGGARVEDSRNNSAFEFLLADMDVVIAMLRCRIAAMVGVDETALETPQVLHYGVGQRFEPHFDFLEGEMSGHTEELALRGQRIATCLVYLNADFEGGETDFPILRQRHRPLAGGALCFANVDPSGTPDRRTLHAGLAPTSGEKWLFSQWIRDRPAAA